ncbi:hypothetical protein A33Q_4641 [Indibacter alkaliphilus LW1]|uniref:Uncharacterized protein n=1 Tax=Indibacter alkaliphilus (strain CCUG 57479 / KCTC 22604 / LW1) TaxID=1189612 RepID=S2DP62_INDAL|nr:hypothetical protein [Indibacter alkaliphilus]EOZ91573.1 hypothetical protein A33Q_4641 [Indibacter alkaliphilus LW1]
MKILFSFLIYSLSILVNKNVINENTIHLSEDIKIQQNHENYASFKIDGAWEGSKNGTAILRLHEGNERHFMTIEINDKQTTPDFILKFQIQSWDPIGLPSPGEYSLVQTSDPENGYSGGIGVTFTKILEYNGPNYYSNKALEYKAPDSWKGTPQGKLIIESIDENYITGKFEFLLWEHASINKAPLTKEKITISEGKFKALIAKN